MHVLLVVAIGYFALNFVCALILHVHGLHQAHLRLRFMDVLMHFLLLSAVAIPVLLVTTCEALFGGDRPLGPGYRPAAQQR